MSNRKKPCPQNLHQGKSKPDENLSTKLGKLNGAKVIARLALPPDTATRQRQQKSEQLSAHVVVALGPIVLDHLVGNHEHPHLALDG